MPDLTITKKHRHIWQLQKIQSWQICHNKVEDEKLERVSCIYKTELKLGYRSDRTAYRDNSNILNELQKSLKVFSW